MVIALWVFLVLALLAMIPLGFEIWRQNEINAAFEEVRHESELIAAHFEHVPDIDAWYLARHSVPDGAAAFKELLERNSGTLNDPRIRFNSHRPELIAHMRGDGTPAPSMAVIQTYIALTDGLAGDLSELFRHEVINAPEVDLERIFLHSTVAEIPQTRAVMLVRLGRETEAAENAVAGLELCARQQWPATLLEGLLLSHQSWGAASSLEFVGEYCQFTLHQWQRILKAAQPRQDVLRRAAQGEAAYHTRLFRQADFREHVLTDGFTSARHGWFDWSDLAEGSSGTARYLREVAASTRSLREVVDAAFAGAAIPFEDTNAFARLAQRERALTLLLQRLRAAASLHIAHHEGTAWAELTLDTASFPDLAMSREGEVLVLKFSFDAQQALASHSEWLGSVGDFRLSR